MAAPAANRGRRLFLVLGGVAFLLPSPLCFAADEFDASVGLLVLGSLQATPFVMLAYCRLGPRHRLAAALGAAIVAAYWGLVAWTMHAPLPPGERLRSTAGLGIACWGAVVPIVAGWLMARIGTVGDRDAGRPGN